MCYKCCFFLVVIVLTLFSCISPSGFVINGTVNGLQNGKIYLYADLDGDTLAQAPIIDGKFVMTGHVSELTGAYLIVEDKIKALMFVENTEITATLDLSDKRKNRIEGNGVQKLYNEYVDIFSEEMRRRSKLFYEEYYPAEQANDTVKMKIISKQMADIKRESEEKGATFVRNNADSYLVAYMFMLGMGAMDVDELSERYETLGVHARESKPGKKIMERIKKLSTVTVGKIAPDFVLDTPEGRSLSMHSVKAKVKILDFWASWCGFCRLGNPELREIYKEYHSKGLEIVSVSLDTDKDEWLKAIEEDQLPWLHVADLKGAKEVCQLYLVGVIPFLIILDENNVIVARNLEGNALKNKIASLLECR